ncbi:OsmC family protein [Burkholderiaceae bacterium DAT-1]|nr:OsmC family protein [Burkholderiaceae bacterium DAT-1]
MSESGFSLTLTQRADYQFDVDFGDGIPQLLTDEPAPLGQGAGPNPSRMIAVGVANCLAASLLFAMRKFKNQPEPITAKVDLEIGRNEAGRLRISHIGVSIRIGQKAAEVEQLERILAQFEDFCVVTQSVRGGIDVAVEVVDADGQVVKSR